MSNKCSIADLRRLPVLQGLDDAALAAIAPLFVRKTYNAGQTIFRIGDAANDVYFMLTGCVRLSATSPQGREVIFHDVPPGELFGEMAVLDGGDRAVTAHAIGASELATLNVENFRQVLAAHPAFALAQIEKLALSLRVITQRVYEQSTLLTTERVKSELIRLSRPLNEGDENGIRVIAPLPSQAEIAARIGSHREAISRIMTRLGQQGLVSRENDALHIPDAQALTQSSGS